MTGARVRQEVRPMRGEALYARRQQRTRTRAEAGEMLGVTARTFRRWRGRSNTDGIERLADRSRRGSRRAGRCGAPQGDLVRDAVHGLDREACSRALAGGARRAPFLSLDPEDVAGRRPHGPGSTPAGVPGCQGDVSVPLAEATRALRRVRCGGRRHPEQCSGPPGGPRDAGALQVPLDGSGLALLVHRGSGRHGRSDPADADAPGLAATGGDTHPRLFA